MNIRRYIGYVVFITAIVVTSATADISIDSPVTWDGGGGTLGWVSQFAVGTEGNPVVGGNPAGGGFLSFAFPGSPLVPQTDSIVNSGADWTDGYAGYDTLGLSFDLFVDGPSLGQSFFFETTGGTIWSWDLDTIEDSWNSQTVNFSGSSGWTQSGSESFFDSLADIGQIGIFVSLGTHLGDITYGIDNWAYFDEFFVPEPGSYAMVITALASIALTFRKRISETVSSLLKSNAGSASA